MTDNDFILKVVFYPENGSYSRGDAEVAEKFNTLRQ